MQASQILRRQTVGRVSGMLALSAIIAALSTGCLSFPLPAVVESAQPSTGPTTGDYVPPGTPTIVWVTPASGPECGGTVVRITGNSFGSPATVEFGAGNPALPVAVLCDTMIQAVSPAAKAGTVVLEVQVPNGTAQALFTYVPPDAPTIGSVEPASGSEDGSTVVTIIGTGFTGLTAGDVTFDGMPAMSLAVFSDTLIQAETPPHPAGTAILQVTDADGATAEALFTYVPRDAVTISSVEPASGSEDGYTVVTIIGTGFTGLTAADVTFDGMAAISLTVFSDTMMQVLTPPHPAATVVLQVTAPTGETAEALFTYVPHDAVTISSVEPASGPEDGGTVVTIIGTGFTGAFDVTFDWTSAPLMTVLSDTVIQAETPAHAPGTVILEVWTWDGYTQALFTYVAPGLPTPG